MIPLYYYFKLQLKEPIETVNYESILGKVDFGRRISSLCIKLHIDEKEIKENRSRQLTHTYYKSVSSNVIHSMVSTNNNSDDEYDVLFQKHEQTLDEHFFMGEIDEYLDYHISKMKELLLEDNSIFKINSNISNYNKVENLDKVLTEEFTTNYLRYTFKVGSHSFINKTIGIDQIFLNVLKRYKLSKDSNKATILFSLLEKYELDEIDKYHIINKIDDSTNIIYDEYLRISIAFPQETGGSPHYIHQLFALISLLPDIQLKLAVARGALVALNNFSAEDLIFTVIELLLYIKTLDHLINNIFTSDININFNDFTIVYQNDYYKRFILKYFHEDTIVNNKDSSLTRKHRQYIKDQIDKLLEYNEKNFLNYMELRTFKVPNIQIRKKNSSTIAVLSYMQDQELIDIDIIKKKFSDSQSKNKITQKFLDIIFTYLYFMSEDDFNYEDDINYEDDEEETLSDILPVTHQNLSIDIRGAILVVQKILLEHMMPIKLNKIKSQYINNLIIKENEKEPTKSPITTNYNDEIINKYMNNTNSVNQHSSILTLTSDQVQDDIAAYLSDFTTRKFNYIISIIIPAQN